MDFCPSPSLLLFCVFALDGPQGIAGSAFHIAVPAGDGILLEAIQRIGHAAEHDDLGKTVEEALLFVGIGAAFVGEVHSDTGVDGSDLITDGGGSVVGDTHCFVELFLLILYDFKTDAQGGILRVMDITVAGAEIPDVDLSLVGRTDFLSEIQKHSFEKLPAGDL